MWCVCCGVQVPLKFPALTLTADCLLTADSPNGLLVLLVAPVLGHRPPGGWHLGQGEPGGVLLPLE